VAEGGRRGYTFDTMLLECAGGGDRLSAEELIHCVMSLCDGAELGASFLTKSDVKDVVSFTRSKTSSGKVDIQRLLR
jgi:hypothetical protein